MPVVNLLIQFAACQMYALGIDHDDKITVVLEIAEGRLVLAPEQSSNFSGYTPQYLAVGIGNMPLPLNLIDRCVVGFHLLKS